MNEPLSIDAFSVLQPFGMFYVFKIKAVDLLELSFTDPIRYENGILKGTQRTLDEKKRIGDIKEFVEGSDAAFPNSIIISANYDEFGFNVYDDDIRWRFENEKLIIPTRQKLASIIDGQHRLFGFRDATEQAQNMELVCSVYLDLPNPLQAYLFATINSNQKPVSKSLAYAQFGFNVDDEEAPSWSPDKLSIALHNKFNGEIGSPFYRHIKLAPQIDAFLKAELKNAKWLVSTATVVDGIIRLISSNPKRDKYELQKIDIEKRRRSVLSDDESPLRLLYLETQDIVIYKIVFNYFKAAESQLFAKANDKSSIIKTIGIQGLFDALKVILTNDRKSDRTFRGIDLREERFVKIFSNSTEIDFSNNIYQFSAVGRANISDTILLSSGIIEVPVLRDDMTEMQKDRMHRRIERLQEIKSLFLN